MTCSYHVHVFHDVNVHVLTGYLPSTMSHATKGRDLNTIKCEACRLALMRLSKVGNRQDAFQRAAFMFSERFVQNDLTVEAISAEFKELFKGMKEYAQDNLKHDVSQG